MDERRHDDELAESVRAAWGRPQLSDAERAAFDAELRQRLSAPRPRRWALAGALAVATAVLAVVLVQDRPANGQEAWVDALVEAQEVVAGEHAYSDALAAGVYGWDTSDEQLDVAWDASGSETLDLGYEYEVLAFWLASATDGDSAANTPDAP